MTAPILPGVCRRWKHPFHVDTYATLAEARAALPRAHRFRRVLCGALCLFRRDGWGGVIDYDVIAPERHK